MKNYIKYLVVLLFIAGFSSGCEDFLTPAVDQNKPTDSAVQTVEDLESVVNGSYDDLNRVELYGRDFYVSAEAMSDNAWANNNSGRFIAQDQFNFTVNSGYALGVWDVFYETIAGANLAIGADLESSTEVDHLKGQAYAIRALSHMNLLLAFGQQYVAGGDPSNGVPIKTEYLTADEAEGDDFIPSRDAVADVWAAVESDLNTAVSMLDESSDVATEMDYWAARALQTRYYLYTGQNDAVIPIAEDIINNSGYSITAADALVETWETGSGPNSLFELAFTSTDRLGTDNIARIYRPTNYGDVQVSSDLYNAHQADDVRLNLYNAAGDRMMSKYSDVLGTDNVRVIRYAEVVLNYAEAIAAGGTGAQETALEALNRVADNRYDNGSPYTAPVSVDDVLLERRLELAMEGHRLYDLLRTGRDIEVGDANSARTQLIPADDYRVALPIPDAEIRANSNIEQNEGYNN
ncbi:RagB/SusD family nutrient uptake outer membrane protein [Fodinibius sp.]|uniref:RagB/SusD family nutrient uptake outer membrane protein n=1 Tax=Fodinibius sp. TaxID=1872440 RepID=UPI002ACE98AE|nr:RagB/SusD family nutrient uptake outer membrane protein [Fodinibius sp.]MDZ7657808.1 RagB/SusD family nutrient uptake outer membrane protein [Fodinibius sp.]